MDYSDQNDARSGRSLRQADRQLLAVEFQLGETSGIGEIRLDSHDLGTGGAFLQADLLFELDEVLSLYFQIPGESTRVFVHGRVAWVSRGSEPEHKPAGMGIEFLDLDEETRQRIEQGLAKSPGDAD